MIGKDVLKAALAGLALTAAAVPAARAHNLGEADARELRDYTLTEAAFDRYAQATRNLNGVRIQACDDRSEVASIDEAAARLDAVPAARTAVRSAGMTSREYVLFAFSLLQSGIAAHALGQPGRELPDDVSLTNVDFYLDHAGKLQRLTADREEPACPG
jgi:hypothetical protein